ncbi:MAG: pilus assembly protein [Acidimicrobiia bacterium]|nr:pilus assembly protein [Acidimicrobiia bacterium]
MRFRRNQEGASLVEFALILPVLILLVFGVIEFGTTYNNYLALRGGVRDGARQVTVGNIGSVQSCNNSTYTGANAYTQEIICQTKNRIGSLIGLSQADIRVDVVGDNFTVGQPIVVCAQAPVKSFTGLFSPFMNGRVLSTKVQMRVENQGSIPAATSVTGGEAAQSNWNNCTVTSS